MLRMPEDRVAVVTGASSGIGEAVARDLVAAGFHVYGASRRALENTPSGV
jgi:NAD(P)-dependent dehydrogenase (short-subunit alcohol dehydrogenase family)